MLFQIIKYVEIKQNDRQKEFMLQDKVKILQCITKYWILERNLKKVLFSVHSVSGSGGGLGGKNLRTLVRKYE